MRENDILSRTDKFQVFHGEKVQICREQFEGFKYNVVELTHSVVSHELCPRCRLDEMFRVIVMTLQFSCNGYV